jgi:hypothetical protein
VVLVGLVVIIRPLNLLEVSSNFFLSSDEEIDEVKDQDQNVGLKLKPEIRTTDRNGLFSKVVKRKIILETVVDRDEN